MVNESGDGVDSQQNAERYRLELLERIHATAPLLVMEFAGAGTQALWWLHSVGGSSRTVLEATDRYTPPSLIEAVGFTPERFTSKEVAAALARRGLGRARHLAPPSAPVFGLGLTATIATDRTKRGDHRCEIAVADAFGTTRYGLQLSKGARDRAGEEELIANVVLLAVADACGVLGVPRPALLEDEQLAIELEPSPAIAAFANGEREWVALAPHGAAGADWAAGKAILSGSFNPVHRGHLELGRTAATHLEAEVAFELPLVNAEKAEIDLLEARRRANQFLGGEKILLTRTPLFNQKARLFPGTTFVVGVDTAARLLETRFYGSQGARSEALEELRELRAHFLVAGRSTAEGYLTLSQLAVPPEFAELFEELPEKLFREDLSSSQLRQEWPGGNPFPAPAPTRNPAGEEGRGRG